MVEDTLSNMYLSIIQPHFSYCLVWGCCWTTELKALQTQQNRTARIVTSSPLDAPVAPPLGRLGWPTINILIIIVIIIIIIIIIMIYIYTGLLGQLEGYYQ